MPKPNRFAHPSDDTSTQAHFKNKRFIFRTENQEQSPLFKVPLEVRQHIYKLILPRSVYRSSLYDDSKNDASINGSCPLRAQRRWSKNADHPSCYWEQGDMVLLRLCRRIHLEARPRFYQHNTFDLLIHSSDPTLQFRPLQPLQSPHTTNSKHLKRLTHLPRPYVRSIRAWTLTIPTHHHASPPPSSDPATSDLGDPADIVAAWNTEWRVFQRLFTALRGRADLEPHLADEWFDAQCAGMSSARHGYRQCVFGGVRRWLELIGEGGDAGVRSVTLVFQPYPDWTGEDYMADPKLVRGVREIWPEWLLGKVSCVRGTLGEDGMELWGLEEKP